MTSQLDSRQSRGVKLTVAAILTFILFVVGGFVYRIQQPRIMSAAELKANGAYMFETPRAIGEFELLDDPPAPSEAPSDTD